jgi:hypothetical protein
METETIAGHVSAKSYNNFYHMLVNFRDGNPESTAGLLRPRFGTLRSPQNRQVEGSGRSGPRFFSF